MRLRAVAQILNFSTPVATIGGWLKAYVFGKAYYPILLSIEPAQQTKIWKLGEAR